MLAVVKTTRNERGATPGSEAATTLEDALVTDALLPDFLDLAGPAPTVEFGVAVTTDQADGGVLVFAEAILVIDGDRHDRVPLNRILGWSIDSGDETFCVDVRSAERTYRACLPNDFRAPTLSALHAALGPAGTAL
ncbi:hypothetical protein [Arenivirga flava]|uniref:Uncharacterized protein n=1 Tax=Arenivirga flava TaxID=1930060 RepID=A0AA37UUC9_9MICO|nr:hypothetical protein [Arenivirga flava]GMA28702.1 hypothetical protein GCM10025874_19550 [Arenivirga flava]